MLITNYVAEDGTEIVINEWYEFQRVFKYISDKWEVEMTNGDLHLTKVKGIVYQESPLPDCSYLLHNNPYQAGGYPKWGAEVLLRKYNKSYSWNLADVTLKIRVLDFGTPPLTETEKFKKEVETMINASPSDPRQFFREIEDKRNRLLTALADRMSKDLQAFENLLMTKDFEETHGEPWIRDGKITWEFGRLGWKMIATLPQLQRLQGWLKDKNYKTMKDIIKETVETLQWRQENDRIGTEHF